MIYTRPHSQRPKAPGCIDRLSELLRCSQGVQVAEPPDKLEKSAGGTRQARQDECWRHVHKLVYKEGNNPWGTTKCEHKLDKLTKTYASMTKADQFLSALAN